MSRTYTIEIAGKVYTHMGMTGHEETPLGDQVMLRIYKQDGQRNVCEEHSYTIGGALTRLSYVEEVQATADLADDDQSDNHYKTWLLEVKYILTDEATHDGGYGFEPSVVENVMKRWNGKLKVWFAESASAEEAARTLYTRVDWSDLSDH